MTVDVFLVGVPQRQRSAALFGQLRDAIETHRLQPGDRLPPTRSLAAELGIGRSTVTAVYGRLVAEGYAVGRTGDGTFVADLASGSGAVAAPMPSLAGTGRTTTTAPDRWTVDLRSGRPDPRLFPVVDWRRSMVTALQQPPPGYAHPAGLPELRRTIAAWVGRSRGVNASADNVLVTAGAQGAFDLFARSFLDPGDLVAFEEPGYAPARHALAATGATIVPIRVDDHGLVVDDVPPGARAVYVTPSHQAPTGVVLAPPRRRDLLALAADHDTYVIEDDYDTEYRYLDRPLEPLQRLDRTGRVLYVGSFSKTLTPSLRLGFLVAPATIIDRLTEQRTHVDIQPPHVTQAGLADFIGGGRFERHLRRATRRYRVRRELILDRVERWRRQGLVAATPRCPAGLHVTIDLAAGIDPETVTAELRDAGVAIDSTADSWLGRDHPPGLVIGFGLADETELTTGLAHVERVLAGGA